MSACQPLPDFAKPYLHAAELALRVAKDACLADCDQVILRLYDDLLREILGATDPRLPPRRDPS